MLLLLYKGGPKFAWEMSRSLLHSNGGMQLLYGVTVYDRTLLEFGLRVLTDGRHNPSRIMPTLQKIYTEELRSIFIRAWIYLVVFVP